jgi:hypothetical protein
MHEKSVGAVLKGYALEWFLPRDSQSLEVYRMIVAPSE